MLNMRANILNYTQLWFEIAIDAERKDADRIPTAAALDG
jgi:hypothetical protein